MGVKYTLPDDMVMMTEEYLESLAASSKVQMEMQALMEDNSGDNIVVLTEDLSSTASIDEKRYIELSKLLLMKWDNVPLQEKHFMNCLIIYLWR